MKNRIIILSLLFMSVSSAQAQVPDNIPESVQRGFNERYPNEKPSWNKEKGETYVATFTENGKVSVVHFDISGQLTERAWYIIFSELPEAAVRYLNKYYGGERALTNILKLENKTGKLFYKARLNAKELVFDSQGIFLKRQSVRN